MITHWNTRSLGHSSIFTGKMWQQRQRLMRESVKRMTKLIHYTFVLTTEKMMRTRRSCWVECLWSRVLCENATKPPSIAPAIGKFKPTLRINQRFCLPNSTGCATRMLTTTLKAFCHMRKERPILQKDLEARTWEEHPTMLLSIDEAQRNKARFEGLARVAVGYTFTK